MQGTRVWAEHPTVSLAQFDKMVRKVSNWGRWGPDDERGTLNLIEPRHVVAAAGLVLLFREAPATAQAWDGATDDDGDAQAAAA